MATNNYRFLDQSGLGQYDGLLKQYISNRKTDIYAVVGTQTSSTAAWTGDLPLDALYDGLIIDYYIPYDVPSSTNVTLDLTLADGTTTGAIDVYVRAGRLTSHYCGGCSVMMTYYSAGSISVGGTTTTNDRWLCDPYYDSNDMATIRPQYGRPTVGGNGLNSSSICAMLSDGTFSSLTLESGTGTKTFDSTNYFDIREIFVYNASTVLSPGDLITANTLSLSGTRFNMRYSFNGVTTSSATSSMQDNLPIYLVFDPTQSSGSCFKLKSPYYTQVPNDTSAIYVLVGYMSDSYRYDLWVYNPAFTWNGTKLIPYVKAALADEATHAADATTVNNHTVGEDVPGGAKFTDYMGYTLLPDESSLQIEGNGVKDSSPNEYGSGIIIMKLARTPNDYYDTYSGILLNRNVNTIDTTTYFDISSILLSTYASPISSGTLSPRKFVYQKSAVSVSANFGNTIASQLIASREVYLVFDRTSESNGCYRLKSPYITQKLNDTQAIYVFLGRTQSSGNYMAVWYRHPAYIMVNGKLVHFPYIQADIVTDTKNTAGSTDTSDKIYLVGARSQATNPQTYSDDEVYTTDGVLTTKSVQVGGGSASMVYDSTTQSINFTFT